MAGKTGEELNIDTNEAEMNKFQGFAQHDGERIAPTPKADAAVAKPQTAAQKAKETAAAAKAKPAAAADEGEDEGEEAPVAAKPEVKSAQDRINKAVGRQRAAERERDAANTRYAAMEARLARLEGGTAAPAAPQAKTPAQQAQQPAADPNDPEPDVSKYEFGEADIKYIKDMARWEVRQEMKADKARTAQQQQTQQLTAKQVETQKQFDKFFARGAELFGDDFETAVRDEGLKLSQPLVELMLDSPHGVEVAYDLANDAELGAKVSAMTQVRQAAWFGSYEDTNYSSDTAGATDDEDGDDENEVVTPPVKTGKPISRAPKPPAHKNRGGGKSETADASTSDFAAFEKMASAQR